MFGRDRAKAAQIWEATMIFEEKTISSEYKYKGKILNLRVDKVTAPKGEATREIVEHNGGVGLLAITDEGKIVMVRQYRYAAGEAALEIPAGKLEEGENPMEAAIRELKEETGYSAGKVQFLFSYYNSIGYSGELMHTYLFTGLIPGEQHFDDDEAIEVEEYTPDEMVEMVRDGRIFDGKTIVAAYFLKDYFREHPELTANK